jgi:HEAT repeat protein
MSCRKKKGIAIAAILIACCYLFTVPLRARPTEGGATALHMERARAILKEGLESKDYKVRIEAVTAMGMINRNEALLTQLEGFLNDKNVDVRLAAVHALADLHSPDSEAALRKALGEDQLPEVSFAAAKVLAELHDPAGDAALKDVYEGKRKSSSGRIKKEERSVLDEFHSTPSALMFILGKGIGNIPVPGAGEGFSAITMLLKDPGVSDRAKVLFILCRSKNAESRELLRGALEDKDWSVRAVGAQMISQTAQTELRDELPPLFEDKNEKVRFRAAGAYLHLFSVAKP